MGASPNRVRRRWDTTSPPPPLVVLTEEGGGQQPPAPAAATSMTTMVPPLGLGRMRSFEAPSSLSAREARSAPVPVPGPLTARPLGVTPRNSAMLGPRSDSALRGMDALGLPISRPAAYVGPAAQLHSPRHLNSPRAALSPRGAPAPGGRGGAADAAARRGENHPRLRSPRAAPPQSDAGNGSEWALAAADSVAEAGGDDAEWLPHALGCRVDVVVGAGGVAGTMSGATLLGPAPAGYASVGSDGWSDAWSVAPAHGAPAWSKVPSWWRHSWPPRAHRTASEGVGLPSAHVTRGPASQIPWEGGRDPGAPPGQTHRPRRVLMPIQVRRRRWCRRRCCAASSPPRASARASCAAARPPSASTARC